MRHVSYLKLKMLYASEGGDVATPISQMTNDLYKGMGKHSKIGKETLLEYCN